MCVYHRKSSKKHNLKNKKIEVAHSFISLSANFLVFREFYLWKNHVTKWFLTTLPESETALLSTPFPSIQPDGHLSPVTSGHPVSCLSKNYNLEGTQV
jgi:hypothetical protein